VGKLEGPKPLKSRGRGFSFYFILRVSTLWKPKGADFSSHFGVYDYTDNILFALRKTYVQRCWLLGKRFPHIACIACEFIKHNVQYAWLKPLSHQTTMPQRLYSVLKRIRRGIRLKISNLSVIACTQRPHSVQTASTRRSHSVFTASMTFSQCASSCCSVFTSRIRRAHGAHTAFSRRLHSVLTAIMTFKMFYLFYFILSNPILQT